MVLEVMKSANVAAVPVVDDGQVVGIVTLGDLARVVLSTDKLLESEFPHFDDCLWAVDLIQRRLGTNPVTEIMTENVSTIGLNATMLEAATLMTSQSIGHLVVESSGEFVGVLSAKDFVRFVARLNHKQIGKLAD